MITLLFCIIFFILGILVQATFNLGIYEDEEDEEVLTDD